MRTIKGIGQAGMAIIEKMGDDLAAVVMETLRDDAGVAYCVCVEGHDDDARREVWTDGVVFGHTADTRAGGGAFVRMAREQERIAAEVWAYAPGREVVPAPREGVLEISFAPGMSEESKALFKQAIDRAHQDHQEESHNTLAPWDVQPAAEPCKHGNKLCPVCHGWGPKPGMSKI